MKISDLPNQQAFIFQNDIKDCEPTPVVSVFMKTNNRKFIETHAFFHGEVPCSFLIEEYDGLDVIPVKY